MTEVSKMSREEFFSKFLALAEEQNKKRKEEFEKLKYLDKEVLDEDGYPTDHACLLVEKWHWDDPIGWFKFIENIWHLHDWGWREEDVPHEYRKDETVRQYKISTAGWSGNEDLIRSMQKNNMLWNTTWIQSKRGGHYIFEVEDVVSE